MPLRGSASSGPHLSASLHVSPLPAQHTLCLLASWASALLGACGCSARQAEWGDLWKELNLCCEKSTHGTWRGSPGSRASSSFLSAHDTAAGPQIWGDGARRYPEAVCLGLGSISTKGSAMTHSVRCDRVRCISHFRSGPFSLAAPIRRSWP